MDEGELAEEDIAWAEIPPGNHKKIASLWRSYWVQWQVWADGIVAYLGLEEDNVMLGRLGSQEKIKACIEQLLPSNRQWRRWAESIALYHFERPHLMVDGQLQDTLSLKLGYVLGSLAKARDLLRKYAGDNDEVNVFLSEPLP